MQYINYNSNDIIRKDVDNLINNNNMSTDFDQYPKDFSPTILKISDDSINVANWKQIKGNNIAYKENLETNEKVTFQFAPIPELVDKQILGLKIITGVSAIFNNVTIQTISVTNNGTDNAIGKFLELDIDTRTLIEKDLCLKDLKMTRECEEKGYDDFGEQAFIFREFKFI